MWMRRWAPAGVEQVVRVSQAGTCSYSVREIVDGANAIIMFIMFGAWIRII